MRPIIFKDPFTVCRSLCHHAVCRRQISDRYMKSGKGKRREWAKRLDIGATREWRKVRGRPPLRLYSTSAILVKRPPLPPGGPRFLSRSGDSRSEPRTLRLTDPNANGE